MFLWNFFESGHEKREDDGAGACIKCALWQHKLAGKYMHLMCMFNTSTIYFKLYICMLYIHVGKRIESVNQIVDWCKVHFSTQDTEYNKHYFLEVKGELSYCEWICFTLVFEGDS